MAYREYKGNLFASPAKCLVNTVNCVGVMGKGVALEFRYRFPQMFAEYRRVCQEGILRPGQILPFRKQSPWILNFAVKDHWKHPSRIEWVESCLVKFASNYERLRIDSVAMPWLGAMNGRLEWEQVHHLIRRHLSHLPNISIELVEFDPHAPDPLFDKLQSTIHTIGWDEFHKRAKITEAASFAIATAIQKQTANSLADVCSLERLGKKTVESVYQFLIGPQDGQEERKPGCPELF